MTRLDTSKTTWDLSPLLAGDDDPNIQKYRETITKAADAFVAKWRPRTDYLEKPEVLKEALDELEAFERLPGSGNEDLYFFLRSAQDSVNPNLKARQGQSTEFAKGIINKFQFFYLAVGKIDPKLQTNFLQVQTLQSYRHMLEKLFAAAKYRLSEPEEKLLTLKSTVANDNWVRMTENFLSKEEREVLHEDGSKGMASQDEMLTLISSQSKEVRDVAGKQFDDLVANYAEIAEAELNSILANKKIDDELRGYDRPDKSRHVSDDIETEVVDALIAAVSQKYDISQRFFRLKAQLLGLPKLRYHERGVEYGNVTKAYDYATAVELVRGVLENLDNDFAQIFDRFVGQGQIDVYPRKGKMGGAFCIHNTIELPVYVLLNYTGKLRDVTVLAHEMGHAINNELMRSQNSLNFATSMATAEVASTFMEDFVIERVAAGVDDETRLAIMLGQAGEAATTIFRQIACYQFEQELHATFRQSGYLSAADINKLFRKHMGSYLGDFAEGCENWWVYWSHIREFFYVYSYASGLLISKAMQAMVREDKSYMNEVKTFLSAGVSQSPQVLFAGMGIDITQQSFWEQGLNEIDQLLGETEALAKKLGKIKA